MSYFSNDLTIYKGFENTIWPIAETPLFFHCKKPSISRPGFHWKYRRMTMVLERAILIGLIVAVPDLKRSEGPSTGTLDLSSELEAESMQIKDFITTRHCVPIDIRWPGEREVPFHWK
jgi:hypothetical protein